MKSVSGKELARVVKRVSGKNVRPILVEYASPEASAHTNPRRKRR